jgi:putative sigma-54 modulation protein
MRDYARDKVQKLEKFAPSMIIDAHVTMFVEKYRHTTEVTLKGRTFTIHAKEETGDMFSSVDILSEKLEKKLHSIKEKLQDHHRKPTHEVETILHVMPGQSGPAAGDRSVTLRSEKFDGKPLFLEDAIQRLQDSHGKFLVFMNAETNRINVIHKISDTEIGVIECP